MKRILLAMFFALACGILFSWPLIYFQYRTGYPLLEVFEVKNQCEEKFKQNCNMIYYYIPDDEFGRPKLAVPDKLVI